MDYPIAFFSDCNPSLLALLTMFSYMIPSALSFCCTQMLTSVAWGPPAVRGVITRTGRSCVDVSRVMSWGQMALPATVSRVQTQTNVKN